MGRTLPMECHHGTTVDWGDFGSCQGYCDEHGHSSRDCPDVPGCEQCREETAQATARYEARESEHERFREALEAIVEMDPVDAILDPTRPIRIAQQALFYKGHSGASAEPGSPGDKS